MMTSPLRRILLLSALASTGALLSACAETRLRDAPDFGEAVRQDVAAQIADPDAHYAGTPDPASNGNRVEWAQQHYNQHHVTEPANTGVGAGGGGGGGGGGDSGGGGGGGAMGQAIGAP